MKLVKARFEKTEFGGQMIETVKAIDFYLEEKNHTSQWEEPEKYKRLQKNIDRLFAQFEIFKLAVKQFYGVEYHFTRTDDYFGCCTNEGEDFLFRFEREKRAGAPNTGRNGTIRENMGNDGGPSGEEPCTIVRK